MRSMVRSTECVVYRRLTAGTNRGVASVKGRKVVGKVGVKCRIRRVLYSIRVRSEQKRKLF